MLRAVRNFVRPYATVPALAVRIVQNLGWVAVLLLASETSDLIALDVVGSGANAAQWATMPEFRELLTSVLRVAALVAAVTVVLDVVRVARSRPARSE